MFRSYLKSLYRNIVRNKFYTFFNVFGLAIGLTSALLILLFIQDEYNFDKHYEDHERIYRLESAFTVNNDVDRYATFPVPLGPALKNSVPDIQQMTRVHFAGEMLVKFEENQFFEWDFVYADSTVFNVFSHQFIVGNPGQSLTEPNSIVLTESTAFRYFGESNTIGQILTDGKNNSYIVTGIIKDLPQNTHLKYNALISMSTKPEDYSITKASRFWRTVLYTYIKINKQSSIEDVHTKFLDYYLQNMEPLGKRFNVSFELLSTPLKDTHFREGLLSERPTGNKSYIIIFSAIALFVLLIASINYMNMATARSANRSKEVGIRKVLGADKGQLIRQFLNASFFMALIALVFALLFVWLLLSNFNEFTGKQIPLNLAQNVWVLAGISAITLITGLISGSYPAFYMSSFSPVLVLKGSVSKSGRSSRFLRKLLVAIQFFIAVFMIISTFIVSGQLKFLEDKDLGYDKSNMIIVEIDDENFKSKVNTFKNEILQNPSVISVTNSTGVPSITRWMRSMKVESDEGMLDESLFYIETDYDFTAAYDLRVSQGRSFSKSMGTDSLEAVLINETTAYKLGWVQDPIGKRIHYGFNQDGTGGRMLKVIGVIDDFNFESLHTAIEPIILFIQETPGELLSIKFQGDNIEETIAFLENKWDDFGPAYPFRYEYLEERLDNMYTSDNKMGTITRIGSLITILLALLGLLGLSSFIAEQKTKEVGIRKVHGATLGNILALLYKDFVFLFLMAFLVAAPLAWWRLSIWLETEFSYQVEVRWTVFLYAGLLAIIIGIATISFFIVRTALGNPVEAIKHE